MKAGKPLLAAAWAAFAVAVLASPSVRGWILRPIALRLPTGQTIRPAGDLVTFNGRPVDLVVSPDGKTVFVKDNRGIVVLDAGDWTVRQELGFPRGGGSMHGIALSPDGTCLYATNSDNLLCEADVDAAGRLVWKRQIPIPGPGGKGASYPCGVALSPNGSTACVSLSCNNSLGIVDLKAGTLLRQIPVGVAPLDVALSADGRHAFVSNWGGRRPKEGEATAPSAGTPVLIDSRGVAASGTVSFLDLEAGRETGQVATRLHPGDLELDERAGRLYVANANSDTVTIVDMRTRTVRQTLSTRVDPSMGFGAAPNALALGPDRRTLYVANGGGNVVAVVDVAGERAVMKGFIPTAWYPGGIRVADRRLYTACVKGLGSRSESSERFVPRAAENDTKRPAPPTEQAGRVRRSVYQYLGAVSRIPLPGDAQLRQWSAQVRADAQLAMHARERERGTRTAVPKPIPARVGDPSVFEHVVYVIKENRTYDQILGDMGRGNSDPSLVLYGEKVTPNHHALAREFVLLDNYYCNGVLSADGHSWVTEGNVTDHLEKSFGGFTRSYTFGDDPLTYSSSGFIWDNALAHGRSVRNFGEMDYASPQSGQGFFDVWKAYRAGKRQTFEQKIGIESLRRISARDYPGWSLDIPDALRADRFLQALRGYEANGALPNLTIVYLPQDHTAGSGPDHPSPRAMVADNDLALGRVVEGLSKSRFWSKTCIFVEEDDPQDGFDHVDGHRSLCLVVSPYTKRGALVSRFYNQTSVLHTMERILCLPAMNQMDAGSPLMDACFTATPDLRPYTARPNNIPLDERNPTPKALHGAARYWAQRSRRLRFDGPDRVDDRAMNRVLWHAARGAEAYPAEWEGAHGRGLGTLGLKLSVLKRAEQED
jgi:YVTN family beta-propeller protein